MTCDIGDCRLSDGIQSIFSKGFNGISQNQFTGFYKRKIIAINSETPGSAPAKPRGHLIQAESWYPKTFTSYGLVPWICDLMWLYMAKKDSVDVIESRTLRWGDCLGLSERAQCNDKACSKGEAGELESESEKGCDKGSSSEQFWATSPGI